MGKHIVVTGASPGSIGFATARTLASWGASVVITTRSDPQSAVGLLRAGLPNAVIDAHPLDLSQAASVKRFVDWYRAQHGERLDVLINNAGIRLDLLAALKQPPLSEDGFEKHWRSNYLGTVHLTHLLLPLLLKTARTGGEARIVNVASRSHAAGSNAGLFVPPERYSARIAYGISKLALVHATFELQRRYAGSKVQAYCLDPGVVHTNIADQGLAGSPLIASLRKAFAPIEAFLLMTPEEGAQTQIHCATQPALGGGRYFTHCRPAQASANAQDAQVSAQLWDETQLWLRSPATTAADPRTGHSSGAMTSRQSA